MAKQDTFPRFANCILVFCLHVIYSSSNMPFSVSPLAIIHEIVTVPAQEMHINSQVERKSPFGI